MELLPLPTLSVDFLDHINDAVIVLDSGSQVHYLNDAAVVLTGWKNLVAKGKTIKELFPHQGGVTGLAVEELLAGKGGGALDPDCRLTLPDGSEMAVHGNLLPLHDHGGHLSGAALIFHAADPSFVRKPGKVSCMVTPEMHCAFFDAMLNAGANCRMIYENGCAVDFIYEEVNQSFGKLTGLQDVVGRRASEVIPLVLESTPDFIERLGRIALGGAPERFELYISALNKWLDISAYSPKKGSFIAVFDDITDRKQFHEKLLAGNERMHLIMEATNAGLWESDLSTHTNIWSDELWSLYRSEPQSCKPTFENWLQTIIPEDRQKTEEVVREAVKRGSEFNHMWRTRDAAGRLRWFMSKGTPFKDQHGKVVRYVGIVLDITERKNAEERKKQMELRLRQSQRLETIGTLAGGIAHDFNNILMPILGFAELGSLGLRKEEPLYDYFSEIMLAAERAQNLVSQILTFSKAQENTPAVISVQSVIAEALKLLRPSIPSTITIEQQLDLSCRNILADASQLHQVIVNLCTNAFHAMEAEPGGVLVIELKEVLVDAAMKQQLPQLSAETYVQLSISDTGTGIDEPTMERMFEPFFTTKSVNKGTGLGLSVVHGIISSFRGEITVESIAGKGTTFRLYLPVIQAKSVNATTEKAPPEGSGSILFVDDEPATLKMMTMMMTKLGFTIEALKSPRKALELFRQNPERFDLIITDLTMPEMTGIEFATQVHNTKPLMPIILMTGYGKSIGDAQALSECGICKSLKKPVKLTQIVSTIKELIPSRDMLPHSV